MFELKSLVDISKRLGLRGVVDISGQDLIAVLSRHQPDVRSVFLRLRCGDLTHHRAFNVGSPAYNYRDA
jgi:hypothetical protein